MQFKFQSMDFQQSPVANGILIFVTGNIQMDGDTAFDFSHVFQLLQNAASGYYSKIFFGTAKINPNSPQWYFQIRYVR